MLGPPPPAGPREGPPRSWIWGEEGAPRPRGPKPECLGPSKCEFWVPRVGAGSLDPKSVCERRLAGKQDPWVCLAAPRPQPLEAGTAVLESSPETSSQPSHPVGKQGCGLRRGLPGHLGGAAPASAASRSLRTPLENPLGGGQERPTLGVLESGYCRVPSREGGRARATTPEEPQVGGG